MCAPPVLALAAAGLSAIGTGMGALQANAQAKYQAQVATRNASMEREAAQQDQQNMREAALERYRKIADITGQQRLAAAAGGTGVDFGTSADLQADTEALGAEDVGRLYQRGYQVMRGHDVTTSNYEAQANAARSAGKAALIKGDFDIGSTVLGGASQYGKLKLDYANSKAWRLTQSADAAIRSNPGIF